MRALFSLLLLNVSVVFSLRSSALPRTRPPVRPSVADPSLRDYGNTPVWPLPATAVSAGVNPTLDPTNFTFSFSPDALIAEMTSRYRPLILYHPQGHADASRPALRVVHIDVADASVRQVQQDTDESYALAFSLDGGSASITAATVFGARHALETLSQLVDADRASGAYSVQGLNVSEAPRFAFRGLLVDAARHWLPPNVLLSLLDGMAANKLNALQVGFGIDWSFTVESLAFPNITNLTSYGPPGTHAYSRATVAWLAAEANVRGVRLIPYFELVGHNCLGEALKGIFFCNGAPGGGLPHPLHADTWAALDALFADLRGVFADEYINVGGDEVDISCWQADPEINAWMAARGYAPGDWSWIVAHYYAGLIASAAKAGFKLILFAEAFGALDATNTSLAGSGVVFDGWDAGTPGSLARVLQAPGARAIVSSYCFLAPTQSCPDNLPGGATPNWFTNIQCEIQNASLFPPAALPFLGNILGGHASRWGEQTDGTNIFQFAWPAVMGVAEKLWSPAALTNGSLFGSRQEVFADHRCVLVRRGLPVQPTSAYSWSCPFEWEYAYPPISPLAPAANGHSSWGPPDFGRDQDQELRALESQRAHLLQETARIDTLLEAKRRAAGVGRA